MTSGIPAPKPERVPSQPQPVPVAPQPSEPRRRWWLAVLVLAVAGGAALYLRNVQLQPTTGGGPPVVTVPTSTVTVGPLERILRLTGSTAAKNFAILKAPQMRGGRGSSMGEVREISTGARGSRGGSPAVVSTGGGGGGGGPMMGGGGRGNMGAAMTLTYLITPGVLVKKGDRLAEFDREEMLLRLDEFRSRVEQNEANLANVKAQLEVREKDHALSIKEAIADVDRARLDLKTVPVRSAIDSEQFRLTLEEAQATHKLTVSEAPLMEASLKSQWRLAELSRDEGRAELKRTEANAERLVLRAPMDGLIVMMTVMRRGSADQAQIKAGDQVAAGAPIMQVVDLNSMVVNANVNQVDAEQIRIGAKARVHFDAYPDLELPAEVVGIGAMPKSSAFRAEYVKEVSVSLRLLKLDPRVIPDLSVSADVVLDTEPEAVLVARESIFQEPGGRPYVFLQQPTGWVQREIELNKTSFVAAAVRSGLRAGDVIAAERPRFQEAGKK